MNENEKIEDVELVPDPLKNIAKIDKEMKESNEVIEDIKEDMKELEVPEAVIEKPKFEAKMEAFEELEEIKETIEIIDKTIEDTKERLEDPKVPELKELTKELLLLADLKKLREAMKDYNVAQIHREIDYIIEKYK